MTDELVDIDLPDEPTPQEPVVDTPATKPVDDVAPQDDGLESVEIDMPDDIAKSLVENANLGNPDDKMGIVEITNYPMQVYTDAEEIPAGKPVILLPVMRVRELFTRMVNAGIDIGQVEDINKGKYTAYQRRLLAYFVDIGNSTDNSYVDRALDRSEARWTQGIQHEGRWVRPGKPRIKGNDPVLQIRDKLGIGGAFTYPLWHTGIWVTIKTPSQGSYFNLLRDIFMKKREMGRMSNGMVFSQMNAYTADDVLEYICSNITQTNYESNAKEDLLAIIDWRDIPWLVMAQAHAIYSNGYEFQQPCIAKEGCDHISSGKINLGLTFYTDSNGFTPMQISHMANTKVQRTAADIQRYKSEFVYKCNRTVRLNDEISVRIGDTTAERFRNSGYAWVNEITDSVRTLFSKTMTIEQRQEHIVNMATLDTVRQYSHFFEAIIMHNGDESEEVIIETADQVDSIIRTIQEDVDSTDILYTALAAYWKDSIRAFVGIPSYSCPTCKKVPEPLEGPGVHKELIPLEPIRVFFTLLAHHRDSRLRMEQYRVT